MAARQWMVALGALAALGTMAAAADSVDPAELKAIIAAHPAWGRWLSDPKLAKLTLAGPQMPNSPWRADDIRRPQPKSVATGRACSAPPPADADVLFDGHDLSKWTSDHMSEWTVSHGVLTAGGHVYNFLKTKAAYGDLQIHLEFREPPQPHPPVNPQYHGNSGVFPMGLYELQILDGTNNETYPDGMVGAVYSQNPPLVNAGRRTGMWQCYDIVFHAPKFADGKLAKPARMTAFLNGVLVQDDFPLIGATVHGAVGHYTPHPAELPLAIQDHGNPDSKVSFRNIWVRRL